MCLKSRYHLFGAELFLICAWNVYPVKNHVLFQEMYNIVTRVMSSRKAVLLTSFRLHSKTNVSFELIMLLHEGTPKPTLDT